MGKILEFRSKAKRVEPEVGSKLLEMAGDIDRVILDYVTDPDIDPRELIGVLSHRLGSLMSHLEEKNELWYVCQKVLKKQARID